MSSSQPRREAVPLALEHDDVASSSARASTLDENLHVIKRWESAICWRALKSRTGERPDRLHQRSHPSTRGC